MSDPNDSPGGLLKLLRWAWNQGKAWAALTLGIVALSISEMAQKVAPGKLVQVPAVGLAFLGILLVTIGVISLTADLTVELIGGARRTRRRKRERPDGADAQPITSRRKLVLEGTALVLGLTLLIFSYQHYWHGRYGRLTRWGLPWDLWWRQTQLDTLRLDTKVSDLTWMREGRLRKLVLTQAEVPVLKGLPRRLRAFGLRYGSIAYEVEIPDSIAFLDLRGTNARVRHWPTSLRELKLTGALVRTLEPSMLPRQVSHLLLESEDCDASTLARLPSSIIDLQIDCRNLQRLQALPPNLESLVLRNTQLKELGGVLDSYALRRLVLVNNLNLEGFARLPPRLETLYIEGSALPNSGVLRASQLRELSIDQEIPADELPGSLTALSLPGFAAPEPGATAASVRLPPRLSSLAISPAALPTITGWNQLRCLDLGFQESHVRFLDLPQTLRVLRTGMTVGEEQRLPSQLETLQVREWSDKPVGTRDLSWVPPTVTHLKIDFLHGSSVSEMPGRLQVLKLVTAQDLIELPSLDKLPLRVLSLDGATAISKLPRLPQQLRVLDISHTNIHSLSGLPDHLRVLRLAPNQATTIWGLWGLPKSVTDLTFDDSPDASVPDPTWSIDVCGDGLGRE